MRALAGVAVAGFVLGLAALEIVVTGTHDTITGPFIVLALTLGWAFIGTGLYAIWRRPGQPIGRLMVLVGFLWFTGALPESDSVPLYTIGLVLNGLWVAPFIHLLVAFPSGRVAPRLGRPGGGLAHWVALAPPPGVLFCPGPYTDCPRRPDNLPPVRRRPPLPDSLTTF